MARSVARDCKELDECQKMCEELRIQIKALRNKSATKMLSQIAAEKNVDITKCELRHRYDCTGHFGKIYALHWGYDSQNIVTASQDGKLIVWDSHSGNKQLAITLNSAWVMTCAFSPSYDYIASGGLDNTISVFKTSSTEIADPAIPNSHRFRSKQLYRELEKHDGYISCTRFVDDDASILSASGDGTVILWDIEQRKTESIFMDHLGDVMCIDVNTKTKDQFVSASVDATAKVWDMRASERCIANFPGHESDINAVKWFRDGQSFITGSDDGTVRLFDMRSYRQLNEYFDPHNLSLHAQEPAGVTSVDVSLTGSYIFSAYDNSQVYMWATLTGNKICEMKHEQRVSSLQCSPDGYALATGCWDFNLRIYA
eukprot:509244_1